MKKIMTRSWGMFLLLLAAGQGFAQDYQMKPVQLKTRWAAQVSPVNNLNEYPRPQLERGNWENLNGLWSYAITKKDVTFPEVFKGNILVPYPLESALSGVKRTLLPEQLLWYKRSVQVKELKKGQRLLLNFGAVDWQATVFINGREIGSHTGGYTAFSFDITEYVNKGMNELLVKVYDPTNEGVGPHGKQVLKPANIYYTSSSGIWQTVWMEWVPDNYIQDVKITPDVDKEVVKVMVKGKGKAQATVSGCSDCSILDQVQDDDRTTIVIKLPNAKLWCPEDPHLYSLELSLGKDKVQSYFGMRKIEIAKDDQGTDRIFLNNRPYFNLGTLDQGFWPDGLYTAPTDEALAWDIQAIKSMGFNTIRKHIKIEPARWYYHADRLGVLVWQDFVNPNQGLPNGSKAAFETEVLETMRQLHSYPSIVAWVLFNERWGAYDQQRLTEWIKHNDASRVVNGHSGELLYVNEKLRAPSAHPYVSSDMTDVHAYPDPMNAIRQAGKARVVGEFGGIGVAIPHHQWTEFKGWGYVQASAGQFQTRYAKMVSQLKEFRSQGLSASIYTQPFDVEGEENGLMTYDREIIKIPFDSLRKIHAGLVPFPGMVPVVKAKDSEKTESLWSYYQLYREYEQGQKDRRFLKDLLLMSIRMNDKLGGAKIQADYLKGLSAPLSDAEVRDLAQLVGSSRDPAFALLWSEKMRVEEVIGERATTLAVMNAVYAGELQPMIENKANPDWEKIEPLALKYGDPGKEIYFRAKTLHHLNKAEWIEYRSAAKYYLEHYGKNLNAKEYEGLMNAIAQHQ